MIIRPTYSDERQVHALGNCINLKRLRDVLPHDDYVLHASRWWRVAEERYPEMAYDLEIAGPSDPKNPETATLTGGEEDLTVVASAFSGLQFRDGILLDVTWPNLELIYVRDARMREDGGDASDEQVFGIFSRHYRGDGSTYYDPIDPEMQPGVASIWRLDPRYDLILDWEPVDVAGLLTGMQEKTRG
jgi:hypothetical protein